MSVSTPSFAPVEYFRVRRVESFEELISTPLENGVNALYWPRTLRGDYAEIARHFAVEEGINPVDEEELLALPLSEEGQLAREQVLKDLESLRGADLLPNLDCVKGGARKLGDGLFPTDVYSYHVDSATAPADTYLCTYVGACSEALRNEEAIRRVDVPETRLELLRDFGGEEGEAFQEYLNENFYDLHYVPKSGATPFAFGIGNLWRIATEYPGSPVPPCVHRAPLTLPGDETRLLLIS